MTIKRLICAGALCLLSACNLAERGEWSSSFATWNSLKAQNGDSYTYASSFGSWTGYTSTTRFTVVNGEVTERSFESSQRLDDGTEQIESWTERGEELGEREAGAPVRTVNEVYAACRDEVLIQNPFANSVGFETDERGLLAACYYVPNGCADDCSKGVNISELKFD